MQKGTPTLWPTCLKLSAVISLPSMGLLCLPLSAQAQEGVQPLSTESAAHFSQPDSNGIELSPSRPSTTVPPSETGEQTAIPLQVIPAPASATPQVEAAGFAAQFSPTAETMPEVTTELTQAETPGSEAQLGQAEAAEPEAMPVPAEQPPKDEVFRPLPGSETPDDGDAVSPSPVLENPADESGEVIPSESSEETDELDATIDDPDGTLDTEESDTVADPAEADPSLEVDTPEPPPESPTEAELDMNTGEDSPSPVVPAPALSEEGAPIPVETVIDELQFLDPNPNPLLIQTQPEEVEIIGTQPITLEEAVELAYRNNPDLRIVQLELEQSQAALREAQAALFPTISVNGTLQGQNTTSTSFASGAGGTLSTVSEETIGAFGSAQIDATYSVFSSGARAASIRAAKEQVRFSELEVERRREELRVNVANDYYDLQEAIESIRISRAFLEEAERNLRDTSLREEVGVGTRFDVLRAEVQVANARQDLVNAQANRQVAERTLASSLNVPPTLTITTTPVEIAGDWGLTLEESIVQAYQSRAELEQQLNQREISEQLRRQELSVLGPQVDLFANYLVSDTLTTSDSFDDTYQFGVQVSMNLFEGGAARARARQQEANIEIAERNFEEFRNTIRAAVESAYFTLESNFTNIDTASLAVEQAQEALDLAILRFDAGVGTQLDILNAQSELTDAEVNLVQAIVGYNRSLAALQRAVSNLPESTYTEIDF